MTGGSIVEYLVLANIKYRGEVGWRSCSAGVMHLEFNRNLDKPDQIAIGSIHRSIGELHKKKFVEYRPCPDAVSYLDSVTHFCTLTDAGVAEFERRGKRVRRDGRRLEQAAPAGGLRGDKHVG